MAIAYVNTGTGTSDSSAGSIATAATSHTAGALLVIGVTWTTAGVTVSSVANTAGDTWVQATGALNTSNATQRTDIWFCLNSAGHASDVVTATLSGNATLRRIICNQYSGVALTSAFDVSTTGYVATGTSITSGNLVTTQADEVIFAFINTISGTTLTAGTNFTLRGSTVGNSRTEDRIVSSTGTYTASFTGTSNSVMSMSVATFKAVAGAAAPLFRPSKLVGLGSGGPFFQNPIN